MKVSELEGNELDYWVARANGMKKGINNYVGYSSHWAAGGPIIDKLPMTIRPSANGYEALMPVEGQPLAWWEGKGETRLIAAMRCFVASRFGNTVDDSQAHSV